jgi:hypothetical protein
MNLHPARAERARRACAPTTHRGRGGGVPAALMHSLRYSKLARRPRDDGFDFPGETPYYSPRL